MKIWFSSSLRPIIFGYLFLCLILMLSCGDPPDSQVEDTAFIALFDGKTLGGWEYDPIYWRVEHGVLVGEVTPETLLDRNSFIIKKDLITRDFELIVEYRVSALGNSGINYRSERIDSVPYALKGYQCDIDGRDRWSGQNYEERGRQFLALRGQQKRIGSGADQPITHAEIGAILGQTDPKRDSLQALIKKEDWNRCSLVVQGNHMQHYINGALMSEVIDNDPEQRKMEGQLGVQVHVGPPMKIEYRNFRYREITDTDQ